jgi:hypothetical protein
LSQSFTPQFVRGVYRLYTWYFYHGVGVNCDFLLLLFCFGWSIHWPALYPLVFTDYGSLEWNEIFPFPSTHFAHVGVLLCLTITPVRISVIDYRMSLSQAALTTTLLSLPTTCISPIGWHHATESSHCPHSSLCKLHVGKTGFLLDSWSLKMEPNRLSQNVSKNLSLFGV